MEAKAQTQQYLTPPEEKAVVEFMLRMSDFGQAVRIKHVPFIAFSATRHRPASDRPVKPPGKNWAKALERRHPDLQARKVNALDWNRHEKNIYPKTTHWFEVIKKVIQDESVSAENVYNMDETRVMLSMLGSVKVLVRTNDTRDYRGARVKRKMVTAIECISGDGRYLKPMIIWPATTHRSNWTTYPTPGWYYACSESGYTDSTISLEWLKRVFDPQTKERADCSPRVLISDVFATHETLEILEYCFANNIILCRLPSHTSQKLQPCDIAVFSPLKAAYRDNVERLERGDVNTIGKEHFISLYCPARERAFTKRSILAGWSKAGLFPFNPDRVLRALPNPANDPAKVDVASAELAVHAAPLSTPITPATPVSTEAFISLQNLLIKQDAHSLDAKTKQNFQRHLQKLVKAAQTFLAKNALQQDQIQFLLTINNEAKVRPSTMSIVLGKAKVMSYEDLTEARAKRAEKEAAKIDKNENKRKRGQEQGGEAPDAGTSRPKVARSSEEPKTAIATGTVVETQVARDVTMPEQGRAPVARMW